jgi:hypothetical protein
MTNEDPRPDPAAAKPDVFRENYRGLTSVDQAYMVAVKQKARELNNVFGNLPPGREVHIAMTKLEEAVMWAVKAITK